MLGNYAYIFHSERTRIPIKNLPIASRARKGILYHFEKFLQKSTLDLMTAHWVMEGTSLIREKMLFSDFIYSLLENGKVVML